MTTKAELKAELDEARAQHAREEALLSTPVVLTYTLEAIGLPPRVRNPLGAENIHCVDKLVRLSERHVSRIPKIGPHAMKQILAALKPHDLTLGMQLGVDLKHEPQPIPPNMDFRSSGHM